MVFWAMVVGIMLSAPAAAAVYVATSVPLRSCLAVWMLVEVIFFLCFCFKWRKANGMKPILVDEEDMQSFKKVMEAMLEDGRELDMKPLIRGWFYEAPWELIRYDNMLDLLAMCFFHGKPSMLSPTQLQLLTDFIKLQETTWGIYLPPGYTKGLRYKDHIAQRLRAVHRPLAVYLWVEGVHLLAGLILRCLGFQRYQGAAFDYWLRVPKGAAKDPAEAEAFKQANGCNGLIDVGQAVEAATSLMNGLDEDSERTPDTVVPAWACLETLPSQLCMTSLDGVTVGKGRQGAVAQVFVHGLGLGLGLYLPFLANMLHWRKPKRRAPSHKKMEPSDSPVDRDAPRYDNDTVTMLVDIPHVSHRLWARKAPTLKQLADQLAAVLELHGIGAAHCVGHSFGTFVVARLCKKFPAKVRSATLIDPVCFGLYMPDIVTAIIYCNPILDCVRYFMVARELQVAETLCRDFQWYHFNLWRDELPHKTLVVLSMRDTIVPVNHVARFLKGTHADVLWLKGEHGSFMACPNAQTQIVTWLDGAHKNST